MTRRYYKSIVYFLGIVIILLNYSNFLLPVSASTGSTKTDIKSQLDATGETAWGTAATPMTLAIIIQYAISAFLGLLGIIFIVLIIYAGYNWMTAQGDEEKVTKAKNTLIQAIIGLIIIVAAYSITYFVFNSLPNGPGGGGGSMPL